MKVIEDKVYHYSERWGERFKNKFSMRHDGYSLRVILLELWRVMIYRGAVSVEDESKEE